MIVIRDGGVIILFFVIGEAASIVGAGVSGIENERLIVVRDGAIVVLLALVCRPP